MIRLFQIEWTKNKSNPTFWVLLGLYAVGVYMVCSLGTVLMNATINVSSNGPTPVEAPPLINIYEFPGIWHNMTYIASYLRIFLGIMIVMAVSNELSYRTMRQNIIDGMSHFEFLMTKLIHVLLLGVLSTLIVFGVTYLFGMRYAEVTSSEDFWLRVDFIGAFFIQSISFMSFALFITLLFRSTGLSIVFVIAYSFFLETIFKWLFLDSDSVVAKLLPIQAMDNLIQAPFNLFEPDAAQTEVQAVSLAIAFGWFVTFTIFSYWILKKRDL